MILICVVVASIVCALLAAFGVHVDVTLPLSIAFIAGGLLFVADVADVVRNRRVNG